MALGLALFLQWSGIFSRIGIGVVGTVFLLNLLHKASKSTIAVIRMRLQHRYSGSSALQDMCAVLTKINLAYLVCSCFPTSLLHISDAITQRHTVSHTIPQMEEAALCKPQTLGNFSCFSTGPYKWLKLFSRCWCIFRMSRFFFSFYFWGLGLMLLSNPDLKKNIFCDDSNFYLEK